jgi:hypothetical protein
MGEREDEEEKRGKRNGKKRGLQYGKVRGNKKREIEGREMEGREIDIEVIVCGVEGRSLSLGERLKEGGMERRV